MEANDLPARTVAGVVLAAGAGSRFEGSTHKLLAPLKGKPVVRWVFDAVAAAGFDRVYVITGAVDLAPHIPPEFTSVHAEDWELGPAHTLQAAIRQAEADGVEAMIVGLGDQPMVPAAAWRSVGAAAGAIVTASIAGHRRPPVTVHHSVWPLLPSTGDEGARALLRSRPDLVSEIPCRGNPFDIDTAEDLARWS